MNKLELIYEARNHVSAIAKNTKTEKNDHVTTCYIGDSGSLVVTKIQKGWSTRRTAIKFPNKCTKKQVIEELDYKKQMQEAWENSY